ncbi:hypothetical protein [Actinomadura violacea]|uniref:Uncharacterized protein n=1 Tax=Actinomadura violacea TaxID=2819934 RepID=A0ABS3RXQ0_9ACTN|nr:hypothetical protein [Actinomadura violacea]MBO2461477.1 hypothetical protein [Actinomadura violacea]
MPQCAASPLRRLLADSGTGTGSGVPDPAGATCLDDARTALSLITMWALQTGRTLPAVPIEQLTARQLEDFWADDSMLA